MLLPTEIYTAAENLHDFQRSGQIIVISLLTGSLICFFLSQEIYYSSKRIIFSFAVVILLGAISAFFSAEPLWGLVELATFVGCTAIFIVVATICQQYRQRAENVVLIAVAFSCSCLIVKFFASYVAAYVSGLHIIDPHLLIGGFDNTRFFAQFAVLVLPLLAIPIIKASSHRHFCWGLLSISWGLLIFSGSRGAWIAAGLVIVLYFFFGSGLRQWASIQIRGVLLGFGFFLLIGEAIPLLLGMQVSNHVADRLTLNSSGRILLWEHAYTVWKQHLILGIGPMQLAGDYAGGAAAHPHQLLLQWAAEWGSISLVIMIGIAWCAMRHVITRLNSFELENSRPDVFSGCLFASVLSALFLGMVDGVFVMPISQTWFAILAGCLAGAIASETKGKVRKLSLSAAWIGSVFFSSAAILLIGILVWDWPLGEYGKADLDTQNATEILQPRFWLRGRFGEGS